MNKNLTELIGRITSQVSRSGYVDGIDAEKRRTLGGSYWKKISGTNKLSYLETTKYIITDSLDSDFHLGDKSFNNALMGYVPKFIESCYRVYSKWYTENSVFDFPNKLLKQQFISKSAYSYAKLLRAVEQYHKKPLKRKAAVPEHPIVRNLIFKHIDMIWENINIIRQLPIDEQHDRIREGIVGNTNAGYPVFTKQTKNNIGKLFTDFCQQFLPTTYSKWIKYFKNKTALQVDIIFDAIREAQDCELYFPYKLFRRTQGGTDETKVRAVYGAFVLLKVLGGLWKTAKDMAKDEHGIVKYGKLEIIAWEAWDSQFAKLSSLVPEMDEEGNINRYSKNELIEKFGDPARSIPEEKNIFYEVYGEDFSGYDQSLIYEDLNWIETHPKAGWIFKYVLNTLLKSEVWVGNLRIFDVFFKSGHPFTSLFGSIVHLGIMFNAADYMDAKLLGAIVLSDDNLGFWYNFDEKKYIEYSESLGLELSMEKSSKYSRDKLVVFLKNLVGYSTINHVRTFIADPQSRYYNLIHSESLLREDRIYPERDVWHITGELDVDSFWSKLASFASTATIVVEGIITAVRSTQLGMKAIQALINMQTSKRELEEAYPVRTDLNVGFHPSWLLGVRVPTGILMQT